MLHQDSKGLTFSLSNSYSKYQIYWICQIFGWGAFVAYEIVNLLGLGFFSWENALFMGLAAPLGLGATHAYRSVVIRWRILELPFIQMALMGLLAIFGLSFILFILTSLLEWSIQGVNILATMNSQQVFMSILNWSRYVFVWVLIYHLYGLMEQVNRTKIDQLESERQLKSIELQNLKAQLNPHFLFNALNSIKALTHSDAKKAGDAVMLLSDLLRYSLNYEKHTLIPLSDELAVTQDYLALEKIRFNQRLEYTFDIESEAKKCLIPPILLVTLAENAIKHGISQSIQGGFVRIKGFVENDFLHLEVCNTGQFSPSNTSQGIGVANICRRLDMLFGGKAIFKIQQDLLDHSVTAAVQIPAH